MEYLTRIPLHVAAHHLVKFHPLCKDLKLLNLCFADDLMIFCKAYTPTVQSLLDGFEHFSRATGLQANKSKSQIFITKADEQVCNDITTLTSFGLGTFPIKYLGIPLSPRRWTKADCNAVTEKITKCIQCWTSRTLSYAGRLQVINSMLFSMHTYQSSLFILLKGVIKSSEAICRNFLEGQKVEYVKAPLVAWDLVCKPKSAGGLGIINCGYWNTAATAKHLCYITNEKAFLQVKQVHGIYIGDQTMWAIESKENIAWDQRKILKTQARMDEGYTSNQWRGSPNGKYTISVGYKWLMDPMENTPFSQNYLCRYNVLRHALCLWRLTLRRIPANDRLIKMGLSLRSAHCELCHCKQETHQHVFFECSYSQSVLQNVLSNLGFHTGLHRMEELLVAPAYCELENVYKQILYASLAAITYSL